MAKRLLVTLLGLFWLSGLLAQSDTIVYSQDFENYQPGDMLMFDFDSLTPHFQGLETWIIYRGAAVSSSWYEDGDRTADDWLVTPPITLPSKPVLMWDAYTPNSTYRDGYQVLVTTNVDNPQDTASYDVVFSISAENPQWTTRAISLQDYAGQTVRIAWRNNSTDKYLLFIDNIVVFQQKPLNLALVEANAPKYIQAGESVNFTFTVRNYGADTVNSFDVNYQVNDNEVVTQHVDVNLGLIQDYTMGFMEPFTDTAVGVYDVKVWISNVNGRTDDYNADDSATRRFAYWREATMHKLLIEHFTQASCAPCANANPQLYNVLNQNPGKTVHIAYHTSWPGVDPMYDFNQEESDARVSYYGINAVPTVVVNGTEYAYPTDINDSYIAMRYKQTQFIYIDAVKNPNSYTFYIKLRPTVKIYSPVILHAVWVEDLHYDSPPGSNGETDFPDVMRKMLPDDGGTLIDSIAQGDSLTVELSYAKPTEIVDSASKLMVFVQDAETKQVYAVEQFSILSMPTNVPKVAEAKIHVYPTVTKDYITVTAEKPLSATVMVLNLEGKSLFKKQVKGNRALINVQNLSSGTYILILRENNYVYRTKFIKL